MGLWETHIVSSVATNTLNFTDAPLTYTYDGTTQKIMVQRIPQYTTVTVSGGAILTASAWNGTKNGVLFFRATGTVSNAGTITMSNNGFVGGAAHASAYTGGYGGDSLSGAGGAPYVGGHAGGGGGGGAAGNRVGGSGVYGGGGCV